MSYSREFRTALYSLDGVGVKHYLKILNYLIKHEITEADFWVNKGAIWQNLSINKKIESSIFKFKKENNSYSYYQQLLAKNIRVVFHHDQEYPILLKNLDFYPPILFVKGGKLELNQTLGVVGTRKITPYGEQVIKFLIPDLAMTRVIISGFMYGVDVVAQQTALDSGGKTVGVLGFGFDFMYPATHRQLFTDFLNRGASFISPFAPHVAPRPGNFPARNILVAGLSQGLCVIEAAINSGSLLTATVAAELGRDVWAVPGSIFSPFSEGVQELLKQGAGLVRVPADIEQALLGSPDKNHQLVSILNEHEQKTLAVLQTKRCCFDELLMATRLSTVDLQASLLNLQLKNLVKEQGIWWFPKL